MVNRTKILKIIFACGAACGIIIVAVLEDQPILPIVSVMVEIFHSRRRYDYVYLQTRRFTEIIRGF